MVSPFLVSCFISSSPLFSPLLPPFASGTPWSLRDTTAVGRTYLCLFDRTQGPRHRRILHRASIQEELNVPRLPRYMYTRERQGRGRRHTGTPGHRDNRTGTFERAEQWSEERGRGRTIGNERHVGMTALLPLCSVVQCCTRCNTNVNTHSVVTRQ